jgi:hypothetical protein
MLPWQVLEISIKSVLANPFNKIPTYQYGDIFVRYFEQFSKNNAILKSEL